MGWKLDYVEVEYRTLLSFRNEEPVGRSEVVWCFDGRSWTWKRLDFRLVTDSKYMVLVLNLRILAVHMSRGDVNRWFWNHVVVPDPYICEL